MVRKGKKGGGGRREPERGREGWQEEEEGQMEEKEGEGRRGAPDPKLGPCSAPPGP